MIVEKNSRWVDTQFKDRRVKIRSVITEGDTTVIQYGQHAEDTTHECELTKFLTRFTLLKEYEKIYT